MAPRPNRFVCLFLMTAALVMPSAGMEKPGITYPIFQFPQDRIPRMDGDSGDWAMVPPRYVIGHEQLTDSHQQLPHDPKDLDVRVRVGWVKGLNRLYFLYEAYDNYWDFSRLDLHNDMFEVVVDGDLSGGPLIADLHPDPKLRKSIYSSFQGVHAQNWHIFTPPGEKDWVMVWGCQQPWIRELPYAQAAYRYNFKPGESGKLTLEFYITPFDLASCEGPEHSRETKLREGALIGMAWAVEDYDDVNGSERAFWNLSPSIMMYGDASKLVTFHCMPLESEFLPAIQANWSFTVMDRHARSVAFHDRSIGEVRGWKWDFGDGHTSTARHPLHTYEKDGEYIVTLEVQGPAGTSRNAKVWDVVFR
jgi:hypothetical protein